MRTLIKLTWVEFKLFLRQPIAVFFTLIFPPMMLLLFGSIYGNEPSAFLGGQGSVDVSTPGYCAMIIGTTGLLSAPITLAMYRERGVLRRYRATPLSSLTVIWSQVLVNFFMTVLGIGLLFILARLIYDVRVPEAPLGVIVAGCLSSFSFMAAGFLLATLASSARAANIVGMAIFYPMLFLSGAGMPRQILPEAIQRFGDFLPLTHVTILISDLWYGQGWNLVSLVVLIALLVVSTVTSVLLFRWE